MKNTKLMGNEYEYLNNGKTFTYQNCESTCNNNKLCKGWDYNLDTYACNLYNDVTGMESISSLNYVAGLKTNQNNNNREMTIKDNTYCVAGDSTFYMSTSVDDCGSICSNTDSCYSYTIDNNHPNSCIIMGKNPVCISKQGYTSGFVPSANSTITYQTAPSIYTQLAPSQSSHITSPNSSAYPVHTTCSVPQPHALAPTPPVPIAYYPQQQSTTSVPFSHLSPAYYSQQQPTLISDIMKAKQAFANQKNNTAHF